VARSGRHGRPDLADTVAERVLAVGAWPDGQAAAVAEGSGLAPVERGAIEDHAVIAGLSHRLADVAEGIRTRMDRLGELDAVSQDVLTDVLRAVEEQLWMVRSQRPEPKRH
jgi:starvation-inducible DNA-binding protein